MLVRYTLCGKAGFCRVFSSAVASGGVVKAICISDGKQISNARIKPKGDISGKHLPVLLSYATSASTQFCLPPYFRMHMLT